MYLGSRPCQKGSQSKGLSVEHLHLELEALRHQVELFLAMLLLHVNDLILLLG